MEQLHDGHSRVRVNEGIYSGLDYFTRRMYPIPNKSSPEDEVFHKRSVYHIGKKCIMSCFYINSLSSVGDITLYLLRDAWNLLTAEALTDIKVSIW